jgi:mannan endo-1,6-alpha-mannosidase
MNHFITGWEAGALMGSLIDYWYYTGDDTYNNVTSQGLLFQVGPTNDYMPPNQTTTEGNDDQGFWGMAVMSAAEYNFPNPPSDKPQWLALAQAVFNTQAARWDTEHCNGGLRWQIFTWNAGFDYKNSISQACFFNIASRLALYTGNQSYADWANRTWDWMVDAQLLDQQNWFIYDGAHIDNCSAITPYQWTYNIGAFMLGAAAMYNFTTGSEQELWRQRVDGLINGSMIFFTGENNNIMTEVACEPVNLCDYDQQSFKAYLSRWMAATTKWAPWTYSRIMPLLAASASAAVAQCTGGANGRMCGLKWANNSGEWDGTTGIGQQMAAMEVVLANLISNSSSPLTNDTGGTSIGNPSAGGFYGGGDPLANLAPITPADRAGAAILTLLSLVLLGAGIVFVLVDETSDKTPREMWADAKSVIIVGGGQAVAVLQKRAFQRGGKSSAQGEEKIMERSDSEASTNNLEKEGSTMRPQNVNPLTANATPRGAIPPPPTTTSRLGIFARKPLPVLKEAENSTPAASPSTTAEPKLKSRSSTTFKEAAYSWMTLSEPNIPKLALPTMIAGGERKGSRQRGNSLRKKAVQNAKQNATQDTAPSGSSESEASSQGSTQNSQPGPSKSDKTL